MKKAPKLSEAQVEQKLVDLPEWAQTGDVLQRTFSFDDFPAAMGFVNRMADLAEQQRHHPDILVRYNKVTLSLSTHDAGGITAKDFAFAALADKAVGGGPSA